MGNATHSSLRAILPEGNVPPRSLSWHQYSLGGSISYTYGKHREIQWETPACATDRIRQWETPPTAAVGFYHGRLQPPFASTGVTRTDRHRYANRPRSPRRANVSTEEQLYRYAPASRSIVGFYHGRLQPPFASTGVTRTDRHRYAGVCHSIPGMGPSPPLRSPAFHTDGIQL